jgi:ribonuclease J
VPIPKQRESSRVFPIGVLKVTAYPVDHSAYDAVAYLVEHEGKRVLYTGDLRLHGRKPGMAQRIVREVRGKLDLLITEGTNVGRVETGLRSEAEVEKHACEVVQSSKSLVLVAFSPQNIDRFVSFFKAAVKSGRTFVGDHYLAAVLHLLSLPSLPTLSDLRFYLPERRTRIVKLERLVPHPITRDEILANPQRYVMLTRPSMLRDFSGALPPESRLLYGMWKGYRERAEWVEAEKAIAASAGEVIPCHTSGHAHASDLFSFIAAIDPIRLLPVHTTAHDQFTNRFPKSCLSVQTTIEL